MGNTDINMREYVRATAPLVGLELSDERLQSVAEAFALVIRMAQPALQAELLPQTEPAPVFRA